MGDTNEPSPESNGKVQRNIQKYGLTGIGDDLVTRWTADDDRMSLRALADLFNKAMLEAAIKDQGITPLLGRVETVYDILTSEDTTSGTRIQAKNELRQDGVNVEELTSDFVTRQAIHTYLTKNRGAEYDDNDADPLKRRQAELQRLESRHTAVAERSLESLRNAGELSLGQFQVLVSLQVQCSDCGTQYQMSELLERGGCECSP